MPVRNEDWVLGLSARVALKWVDELIILNHASTDQSVDIIAQLKHEQPRRIHVISVPEAQWNEMQHRQMMLDLARHKRATHIAIIDADEVLTANLLDGGGTGYCCVKGMLERGGMLLLPGYNLRCGLKRFHLNGTWGCRWFSTGFADNPRLYWSSHDRGGYDHHHREPMGLRLDQYRPVAQGRGGVMHLWGVSDRRLRAKHALYKVTERLRWPEKSIQAIDSMYSWWRNGIMQQEPANWNFADVPSEWWDGHKDLLKHLDISAEPWQEQEVRRLVGKFGRAIFAGLDLFGVV